MSCELFADYLGSSICYELCSAVLEGIPRYGVRLTWQGETVEVGDITTCQEEIFSLLKTLAEGSVPPLTVKEVVLDWLER